MAAVHVENFALRSPLYRVLRDGGANFEALAGAAMAVDYGEPAAEAERARTAGLADLSVLPRLGVKGKGATRWLTDQGLDLPDPNQAKLQGDGSLVLRLGGEEYMLLSDLGGAGALIEKTRADWTAGPVPVPADQLRGYLVPRQDTHAWFLVTGAQAAAMFAKVCGVDLRPGKFDDHQIAQTSVARATGVVVRCDQGATLAFHLLVDAASADFFWPAIVDALAEFGGGPVGYRAVTALPDG